MENPFNITKAVDYDDKQLLELWVDFPKKSFQEWIKPSSEMPMIILGSKGSGKTHILKQFSYSLQKKRNEANMGHFKDEGYLGTYLRCSGLNGFKFEGKGQTLDFWETLFAYYLELWLIQLLFNNIIDLIDSCEVILDYESILSEMRLCFDDELASDQSSNFVEFNRHISKLQREIDYAINNIYFDDGDKLKCLAIKCSPGSLIFGIPKILQEKIPLLENMQFLFVLDEFENFTTSQQKYFNTLIRERERPVSFKIGGRRYGFRTKQTLSADEELKEGSEYEILDIDNYFRLNEDSYIEFITKIVKKRVATFGMRMPEEINQLFEDFNTIPFNDYINKAGSRHLNKFIGKILNYTDLNSNTALQAVKFKQDVVIERTNIFQLYRIWKNTGKVTEGDLAKIVEDTKVYTSGAKTISNTYHDKILQKFKKDIEAILCRENNVYNLNYTGFKQLVSISHGIPRHFLIIMKHLYKWYYYEYDNIIFGGNDKISIDIQKKALKDTSDWFYEDAKAPNEDGVNTKYAIANICNYLRELKFSDTPPECSISTFSIDLTQMNEEMSIILDYLVQYSYVVRIEENRRVKNDNRRKATYQINRLLAVKYELSTSRRGVISFDMDTFSTLLRPKLNIGIQDLKEKSSVDKLFHRIDGKYNAPFRSAPSNNPSLFSNY